MDAKTERKTQYRRAYFSKHWQSGGKNAIKNAKQDSPFENFFRIRRNVESQNVDERERKESYFPCHALLTRGMVARISRLKNF
jgi:hypothetical protein